MATNPQPWCPLQFEIIVDHSETANKCTIVPLGYRPDFKIRRFMNGKPMALTSTILLHPNGKPLNEFTAAHPALPLVSIAAIDSVWRRVEPILKWVEKPLPELVSIPKEFATAYPRQSKKNLDPDGGLATIEALFIAATFFGVDDLSLLSEYYFAPKFLEINAGAWQKFGLGVTALDQELLATRKVRNSYERRLARGRASRFPVMPSA